MKIKSLEDYIKDYLKEKAISLGTAGYADWLSQNGQAADRSLAESLINARTEYRTALPTYGANAESLAEGGLQGSGYAEYVKTAANAKLRGAVADARSTYVMENAANAKGYSDYLTKVEEDENALYETVYRRIRSESIPNYEQAYERALSLGLRKTKAEEVAKKASDSVRTDIKRHIAKVTVEEKLSRYQAYRYAISRGLSDEDAIELGELAFSINQSAASDDSLSQTYLDYLEQLKQQQKGEQ